MSRGGEGDDLSAAREQDDANIRWLLAAVLHHQPPEEEPSEETEGA